LPDGIGFRPTDLGAEALQDQVASDDTRQRTPERVTFAGLAREIDARTLTDAGGGAVAPSKSGGSGCYGDNAASGSSRCVVESAVLAR
jgi:hypothetical protein